MKKRITIFLTLIFWVMGFWHAHSQELTSEKEWLDSYKRILKKGELSEADLAQLKKEKFLISQVEFNQIFTPYVEGDAPVYITTDSLLNGFHVILEESIQILEMAHAQNLKELINEWFKKLKIENLPNFLDIKTREKTCIRALIIIGVACTLCNGEMPDVNANIASLIREEVDKILAGQIAAKPSWLGLADSYYAEIDYSRFNPRGFYNDSEILKNYFRAVAWLQSFPLWIFGNDEFLTALLLAKSAQSIENRSFINYINRYSFIFGSTDDLSFTAMFSKNLNYSSPKDLENLRQNIRKFIVGKLGLPKINDQMQVSYKKNSEDMLNIRILPSFRTPEALLFQDTTDPVRFTRAFPSGLEICAALGSKIALDCIADPQKEMIQKTIESHRLDFHGNNLYGKYMDCLKALFNKPEKGAPDFMRSKGWGIKNCNTALASWSLMRHAFILFAEESGTLGCMGEFPPGFVEINPDFYWKLEQLSQKFLNLIKEFVEHENYPQDVRDIYYRWSVLKELCQRLRVLSKKELHNQKFLSDDKEFIKKYGEKLAHIMGYYSNTYYSPDDDAPRIVDVFFNHLQTEKKYLLAGTGRPRLLYVLYPYQGREVLCKGAVMQYYEFAHEKRLNNIEWMKILNSKNPVNIPDWMRPIQSLSNNNNSENVALTKKGIDDFLNTLKEKKEIDFDLLSILGEDCIDPLLKLFSDKNADVRILVITGLSRILDESLKQKLYLLSADQVRSIFELFLNAFQDQSSKVREEALDKILGFPDPCLHQAVDPLIILLQNDPDKYVKWHSVNNLGEIGDKKAEEPLLQSLNEKDPFIKEAVIEALGKLRSEKAVYPLLKMLVNMNKDEKFSVGDKIIEALGNISDPSCEDLLITYLKDDYLGNYTAKALGKMKSKKALETIKKVLEDPKYEFIHQQAAETLGQIGDPAAVGALIAALKSKNSSVRYSAANSLGLLRDPRAVNPLIQLLQDSDDFVRECVLSSLLEIGTPESLKAVKEFIKKQIEGNRNSGIRSEE